MRSLAFAACLLLAACGGSRTSLNPAAAASADAAAQLAQSGVQCESEAPPDAIAACSGKKAGDACTVTHEDDSFTGACADTPKGALTCEPPAAPPRPPAPPFAACADKAAGAACSFTGDDGTTQTGTCRAISEHDKLICAPPADVPQFISVCDGKKAGDSCSFTDDGATLSGTCTALPEGTLLACVPPHPPVTTLPPVEACNNKAADAACSFSDGSKTVTGTCHAFEDGKILVCLPSQLPIRPSRPRPPQEPVDACTSKTATEACSFTWDEETVTGVCKLAPDGTTLVCAPLCGSD